MPQSTPRASRRCMHKRAHPHAPEEKEEDRSSNKRLQQRTRLSGVNRSLSSQLPPPPLAASTERLALNVPVATAAACR